MSEPVRPSIEVKPPQASTEDAERVAWELYGVRATARPLPSERDQNFHLRVGSDVAYVLKLSQAGEARAVLDCQHRVLARLDAALTAYRFPGVVPTRAGEAITRLDIADGATHLVRLLEYVPGMPMAAYRPHTPALHRELGGLLGAVDRILEGFSHPGAQRELKWDLRGGRALVDGWIGDIADRARRARVEGFTALWDARAAPLVPALRTGVIHGDANDHNVLIGGGGSDPLAPRRVTGLIDFGDLGRSWIVAEPAIAAAYAMLGRSDPLAAAAGVVAGYHEPYPLTETEVEALFPLIALRLCVSVVNAAHECRRHPDNAYLSVSEEGVWSLLDRLAATNSDLAHYTLRHACGLEPCPRAPVVAGWLRAHADGIAPVLDRLTEASRTTLDLSVGSAEIAEMDADDDAAVWTECIFGRMRAEGAGLAIGRYDEARRWYAADAFRVETDEGPEWRTIHLGVDLFVEPGTPVHAPLDGTVHALRDNAGRCDYGPTIVLEHRTGDGGTFHTLYGHLTAESLERLRVGAAVRAGERIGAVGAPPDNGDWAPHLHLQIITDPVGFEGTFSGVARPSEREVWLSLSPDPNLILRLPEGCAAAAAASVAELLERRRRGIGASLGVAYRRPLNIVRGRRQYLYDEEGRAYLDCVNNVAHVGHSHPRVVAALARQSAVLNTNTRYLHDNLMRYAERLTAMLPEPLRVCYFVCSGSEANELALRLARTHTGRRDVIVVEGAYHGNTTSLIDISPYKFYGPGGAGAPPWVRTVRAPDPYRGPHRGRGEDTGRRYANDVRRAVERSHDAGRGVAAFFCEPLLGCGGQIVLPDGYMAEAFRHVREAGGVCVADEVQVGLGRVGSHFWGFETQGVVPDIVTLGKPIGNGHPLAAVVTTPEIAASFANGMEYFNTFGGNPVSCAVGLAVLDVIEEERLQERARRVGGRLLAGLRGLMGRHLLLGDARGLGLYLGVELVLDRETLAPAPRHAAYVVERMRDRGILLSTDGPLHNVLKIKPPLVFDEDDADRLVAELDRVLGETPLAIGG